MMRVWESDSIPASAHPGQKKDLQPAERLKKGTGLAILTLASTVAWALVFFLR
jgi:hypothetical protein